MHKINNEKAQLTHAESISVIIFKAKKKIKYLWLSSDLIDVIIIFYSGLKFLFFVLWVYIAQLSCGSSNTNSTPWPCPAHNNLH